MIDITDLSLMDLVTAELDVPGRKSMYFSASGLSFHRPEIIARGDDMSLVVVLYSSPGPCGESDSRMFAGPATPLTEIPDVRFVQTRDNAQWVETPDGYFDGHWKPGLPVWRGVHYTRLTPGNTIAVVTTEGLILTEASRPFRLRHWSEYPPRT